MLLESPRMTASDAVPPDPETGRRPRPAKASRAPERTCIATGAKLAPETMIRFVLGPEARVVPDLARSLPGRGVWTVARASAVRQAIAKKAFARGFRAAVSVDADMAERIEALLLERLLEAVGLARRAGAATAGFAKAREALDARRVGLLLVAGDAGADGPAKLAARGAPTLVVADAAALGRVFGRDAAVYVAVAPGALAERAAAAARRWMDYRDAAQSRAAIDGTGQGSERTK